MNSNKTISLEQNILMTKSFDKFCPLGKTKQQQKTKIKTMTLTLCSNEADITEFYQVGGV